MEHCARSIDHDLLLREQPPRGPQRIRASLDRAARRRRPRPRHARGLDARRGRRARRARRDARRHVRRDARRRPRPPRRDGRGRGLPLRPPGPARPRRQGAARGVRARRQPAPPEPAADPGARVPRVCDGRLRDRAALRVRPGRAPLWHGPVPAAEPRPQGLRAGARAAQLADHRPVRRLLARLRPALEQPRAGLRRLRPQPRDLARRVLRPHRLVDRRRPDARRDPPRLRGRHRPRPRDARVGARLLAEQVPLPHAGRADGRRAPLPRARHPALLKSTGTGSHHGPL